MMTTRKNIASASARMRNLKRSGAPLKCDRCEFFGSSLRSIRLSIVEMAANVVCGILLLTVLTLAGYIADKCWERNEQEFFNQPVWHEPLDNWSL